MGVWIQHIWNTILLANSDPGLCDVLIVYGCMDIVASNFQVDASIDDGSCFYNGCMDTLAVNFESYATMDDGSCLYITQCSIPEQYYGNTGNNMIIGFLPAAIESLPITNDDAYIVAFSNLEMLIGSIQMDVFDGTIAVWGDDNATDEVDGAEPFTEVKLQLVNSNVLYDIILPEITYANNDILLFESADYQIVDCGNDMGCTDSLAMNFDPLVEFDDNSCIYPIYGCMDPFSFNFNPLANINQISAEDLSEPCVAVVNGCTQIASINYNSNANVDDGSCIPYTYGCMDSEAFNFNPFANVSDDSCVDLLEGCMQEQL